MFPGNYAVLIKRKTTRSEITSGRFNTSVMRPEKTTEPSELTVTQPEIISRPVDSVGKRTDPNSVQPNTQPIGRYTGRVSGWECCHPLRIGHRLPTEGIRE